MPYISKQERETYFLTGEMKNAGGLNFALTWHIRHYIEQYGMFYNTTINVVARWQARSIVMLSTGLFNYTHNSGLEKELDQVVGVYIGQHGNDIETCRDTAGAIACFWQEFYRQFAGPYEDEKRRLNGPV